MSNEALKDKLKSSLVAQLEGGAKCNALHLLQEPVSEGGLRILGDTVLKQESIYNLCRMYEHLSHITEKVDGNLYISRYPNGSSVAAIVTLYATRNDDNELDMSRIHTPLVKGDFPAGVYEGVIPHITLPVLLLLGDVTMDVIGGRVVVKHNKYNVTFNFYLDDK